MSTRFLARFDEAAASVEAWIAELMDGGVDHNEREIVTEENDRELIMACIACHTAVTPEGLEAEDGPILTAALLDWAAASMEYSFAEYPEEDKATEAELGAKEGPGRAGRSIAPLFYQAHFQSFRELSERIAKLEKIKEGIMGNRLVMFTVPRRVAWA